MSVSPSVFASMAVVHIYKKSVMLNKYMYTTTALIRLLFIKVYKPPVDVAAIAADI